ncbi:MAG: MFS transporter, partial [bacterium]|nr:MFS transporter [bacterium]
SDPARSGLKPWGEKKDLSGQENGEGASQKRIQVNSLFKNNRFWFIGCSYFAIAYSLYGITTFMVDYAKYQLNLPLEKASLLATIHGIGQIAGVLTVLPLSDYLGRKKTIIISNTIITGCLAAILLFGDSWVMLYIFIGCLAIFYGATFPIYGACAGDYFPRESMGTVIGAWTPFYGLGAILTHWITGMLRDATGVYNHAFFINVLMGVVAVVLMSLVRKR